MKPKITRMELQPVVDYKKLLKMHISAWFHTDGCFANVSIGDYAKITCAEIAALHNLRQEIIDEDDINTG